MDRLKIASGRLGPVGPCELDIRPLTVFIGKQGTGKSLIAQVLYALEELPFLAQYVAAQKKRGEQLDGEEIFARVLDRLRSAERRFARFASGKTEKLHRRARPRRCRGRARRRDELAAEPGTAVTSDEPLSVFALDDDDRRWWKDGEKHPDAALVASWRGSACVIFLELTGTLKLRVKKKTGQVVDPMIRKAAQIDAAVEHFHPSGRSGGASSHGDEHHDRWTSGEDLPRPTPERTHLVGGVVIGFHQQARTPLGPKTFFGHRVPRFAWSPVPSTRNRAVIRFADLARQLGW